MLPSVASRLEPNRPKSHDVTPASCSAKISPTKSAALPVASDYIDLGLYDPAHIRRPTLRFEVDDVGGSLARLAEIGMSPNGELPSPLRQVPAAVLVAPEGTPILLSCGTPG